MSTPVRVVRVGMSTYYKATDLNGCTRNGVQWTVGEITRHPTSTAMVRDEAETYLSVSVEPAETLIGGRWPCRLFEVEPVGDVIDSSSYPHKRAGLAFRVIRELPAWQTLGPNGQQVAAFIARIKSATPDEISRLVAAWDAAWDAARDAARAAAWAAEALVVRDIITPDQFNILAGPVMTVFGQPETWPVTVAHAGRPRRCPMSAELPVGTRVVRPGFGYVGHIIRYETAHRTRWAVVQWDGRAFTSRENPREITVAHHPDGAS